MTTLSDNILFPGLTKLGVNWRDICNNDPTLSAKLLEYEEQYRQYVVINIDYSSLEVYTLASLSRDKKLIDALHSGADFHSLNAANIHKLDYYDLVRRNTADPEGTKAEWSFFQSLRKSAKSLTFSLLYGASVAKIASDLRIDLSEAQLLIDGFYNTYPKVREWQHNQIIFAVENGYIKDGWGRRRDVPELFNRKDAIDAFVKNDYATISKLRKKNDFWLLRKGVKTVGNTPIQSTASCQCAKAAALIHEAWKDLDDRRFMFFVHDAITFWVHIDSAVDAITEARRIMEHDVKMPDDPVVYQTSLDIGYNYEFMRESKIPSTAVLTKEYIRQEADKALELDDSRKFKLLVKSTSTILSDNYVSDVVDSKMEYYNQLVQSMGIEGIETFDDYMSYSNGMTREEWFAAIEEDAESRRRGFSWDEEEPEE